MGEVIDVNFTDIKEDSGYILNDRAIDGVYKSNVVAVRTDLDNGCVIGLKGDNQVFNPVELSIDDLNEFCVMWLCIFNPSVIKEDKD